MQVHDELVLEVDPSILREAGMLLKMCMENAASLLGLCLIICQTSYMTGVYSTNVFYGFSVPLQVKLKVGRTWGSLEAFDIDE